MEPAKEEQQDTTEAVGQRPEEALEGKQLEAAVGQALGKMSERERAARVGGAPAEPGVDVGA